MRLLSTVRGVSLALAFAVLATLPSGATAAHRPKKRHLLVVTVTKGFRHDSIPLAEATIQKLGDATGDWDTDFVRTDEEMQAKMTKLALKKYDAICFANTTGVLPLPDPEAFLSFIRTGHGFIAMHSGSDTFHEWPGGPKGEVSAYIRMLGAEFLTHHSQSAVDMRLYDPSHPATNAVALAGKSAPSATDVDLHEHTAVYSGGWKAFDEIYLFKNVDRPALHVLLAVDKHPDDGSPEANQPGENLISWCKAYGRGRVFYTSLGHRQEVWRDPLYQLHITGGIRFALGLARGSTTPNPLTASAR